MIRGHGHQIICWWVNDEFVGPTSFPRSARIWSGQMLYEIGIRETITFWFGEMMFTNVEIAGAHVAATPSNISEDKHQYGLNYDRFLVFSKPSGLQNADAAHVFVWHLHQPHLVPVFFFFFRNGCLACVGCGVGGGGREYPCHNERSGRHVVETDQVGIHSVIAEIPTVQVST